MPPTLPATPQYDHRPTLTASTKAYRVFRSIFPVAPFPYRTEIEVVNSAATDIQYRDSAGRDERVPQGAIKRYRGSKEAPIIWYSLEPTANTGAEQVVVYERGGVTVAE